MKTLDDVYLTLEKFEKELESCLTILKYPTKKNNFYVCEHVSFALHISKVNVYINQH